MVPILVNERDIEPIVIKKANQFISFKFGDFQLLDIMNFFAEQQDLIDSWRHTKLQKQKVFSNEWFEHPGKIENTEIPP